MKGKLNKRFSDNVTTAGRRLDVHNSAWNFTEPENVFWANQMMLDDSRDRTRCALKDFPTTSVKNQINCLLAATRTQFYSYTLCFGPVSALWFLSLLASQPPTMNSSII